MNELEKNFLVHTAKGTTWDKHKYLYKDSNGNYVYPEDVKNAKYGTTQYDMMTSKNGKTINSKESSNRTIKTTPKLSAKGAKTSSVNKTNQTASQIANKNNSTSNDDIDERIKKAISDYEANKKKEEEAKKKEKATKKKSTTKKSTTKKKTSSKLADEARNLNLSEEDLKLLTSNIDTNAKNRVDVINSLALKVIRGDFGNGQERKDKLGQFYREIQTRVNELIKTMSPRKAKAVRSSNRTSKSTSKTSSKPVKYGSAEYEKQKKGTTINNRKTFKHSDDEEFLMHLGTKKHSGRYAYGSGDRPYQHDPAARRRYNRVNKRRIKKLSDEEIDARITRFKKEAELVRAERDAMTSGEKFTQDMLQEIGKKVIPLAASSAILYIGKKYVTGEWDTEALGDALLKAKGGKKKDK